MKLSEIQLVESNKKYKDLHNRQFDNLQEQLNVQNIDVENILDRIQKFQVAIPSWALGAGGTRFGRFSFEGEPSNIFEKLDDVGLLHKLTNSAGAISLHIPWDTPEDYAAVKERAKLNNIAFDAVNSNTFQDQPSSKYTYRYGSLSNSNKASREQAIQHNIDVIKIGEQLGSKSLTVWLADGSSFPGQINFQKSLVFTEESLKEIYKKLPEDWKIFIEYKPYEPNFYSTVIQDWGTSFMLANACGEQAYTLVDLGHHLPNTNIEQIVSTLMLKGKLGGFHFNDSKYGDDDLTAGSIKPYALFLIFNELVYGMENNPQNPELSYMIDASHNIKDPLEDLLQSVLAIEEAFAKALIVDRSLLREAQEQQDVSLCQELLQDAFRTDVRPLLAQARLKAGAAINPIKTYRDLNIRPSLIKQRGKHSVASGL